jgi:hypothetical protein
MFNAEEKINKEESAEIWKDIPGYEGLYSIGTNGEVYSKRRLIALKQTQDFGGYMQVTLCVNQKRKTHSVHRLVALTFIPNPLGLPQVNHIDGNKLNNCVDNLEWCDQSTNMQHAYKMGLVGTPKKRFIDTIKPKKPAREKKHQSENADNKMSEAQKKALKKYKAKVKRITIEFSPKEAELWEHIQQQPKKQTYIKDLIRADMKKQE